MTQRPGRAVADLLRRRVLQATIALPALGARGALAAELGYPRVMQGPMIGAVTTTSILVWARVSGPHSVEVEYSPSQAFLDTRRTPAVAARAEDDYTVRIELPGLSAATRYWYRVLLDGKEARYGRVPYSARTAPAGRAPVRIAFGSCARVQIDREQRIFDAVRQAEPDLFVWLGDNIYGDSERPELLAEEYRRQRNVAALEPLLATVPQIATWDDHDFGLNNADRTYSARTDSLRVFRNYWANPASGLPETPGVFFRYEYARRGPVHARRPLLSRPEYLARWSRQDDARTRAAGVARGGTAREPLAFQVAGLGQRLVDGRWAAGRHLGGFPWRARPSVRLHP